MQATGLHHSFRKILTARQFLIAFSMTIPFVIADCSYTNYYSDSEEALDTSGYYHLLDHISAYYPSGIALNFPGYIIGFEEAPRDLVTNGREDVLIDESVFSAGHTVERLLKTLRFRVPIISQIMHYEGRPYGEGNCALYNLYHNHGNAVIDPCDENPRISQKMDHDYRSSFVRSWDAIEIFKERLAEDVSTGAYTHLVVAVMGLDTAQEEAIRNYKSIISSIRRNGGESFEPLFVGITWPSFFMNRWFDPVWEAIAYPPVADRADVLGLSWLGVILNEAVMPLSDRIQVTVIGHSFGARAASIGICVGTAIVRTGDQKKGSPRGMVDNFIGIAPAFSLKRFVDDDYLFYENIYYEDHCPEINRFVLTASSNDAAFNAVFWSDAGGDHGQMQKFCKRGHPVSVNCTSATRRGEIKKSDASAKITYIDTSDLMRYTMPGTRGGGHSDVYRPEIGKMLWMIINGAEK